MSKEKIKQEIKSLSKEEINEIKEFVEHLSTGDSKGSSNEHSFENKEIVQHQDAHDKAYDYLESLEKKYSKEIVSNMYSSANILIEKLYEASDFTVGFQQAIKEYKLLKDKDNDGFILIQFLEDFYGRFTINEYYTQEMHDNNFKHASSLAHEINQELIGEIYGIHCNEY
jgi:hypothetical protein